MFIVYSVSSSDVSSDLILKVVFMTNLSSVTESSSSDMSPDSLIECTCITSLSSSVSSSLSSKWMFAHRDAITSSVATALTLVGYCAGSSSSLGFALLELPRSASRFSRIFALIACILSRRAGSSCSHMACGMFRLSLIVGDLRRTLKAAIGDSDSFRTDCIVCATLCTVTVSSRAMSVSSVTLIDQKRVWAMLTGLEWV